MNNTPSIVPDYPELDGTDGAHPAWWRGHDNGVESVVQIIDRLLDEPPREHHFGSAKLTAMVKRINAIRQQIDNGTYETPERLDGTADKLLDAITDTRPSHCGVPCVVTFGTSAGSHWACMKCGSYIHESGDE